MNESRGGGGQCEQVLTKLAHFNQVISVIKQPMFSLWIEIDILNSLKLQYCPDDSEMPDQSYWISWGERTNSDWLFLTLLHSSCSLSLKIVPFL